MINAFKPLIDITMTAVLRPSILSVTLNNIKKHVCKDEINRYRLIINIDPIGENVDPLKIVRVCNKNFQNVIYNIAETPSFPKAVKWVWSQSDAPFIFHWEDDVDILYDIDVDNMINILNRNKELSSLRLYKAATPNKQVFSTFGCKWTYKNDYYLASKREKQFGLNPILIKREFIDEAVKRMVDNINPEKQFRFSQKNMRPLIMKWNYGLYTTPGAPRMIDGRKGQKWKNEMGIDKPKGETFLNWVKKR